MAYIYNQNFKSLQRSGKNIYKYHLINLLHILLSFYNVLVMNCHLLNRFSLNTLKIVSQKNYTWAANRCFFSN